MELGARLKQARLEAGLSQRQLCGDVITRNMLSQIENGSAKPSMDTLRYLSSRLGKPVSYFLDENTVLLPNQVLMEKLRQAQEEQVLELLEDYQSPDPVFDPERWLLEALTCMTLAKRALTEKKNTYACSLLERACAAGRKTPYYTQEHERKRLLLCFEAGLPVEEDRLPILEPELLLRAKAALDRKDPARAANLLDAAAERSSLWHYLRGRAWEASGEFQKAAENYLLAEPWDPPKIYACLERCYKALEDYRRAYEYACKQR